MTDDQIIGAILAGGSVRPIVSRGSFGGGFCGKPKSDGPVCAVSAGILFAGQKSAENPIATFARRFGVPPDFAMGISDGFECDYETYAFHGNDYARGWAIGAAVRAAVDGEVVELSEVRS